MLRPHCTKELAPGQADPPEDNVLSFEAFPTSVSLLAVGTATKVEPPAACYADVTGKLKGSPKREFYHRRRDGPT